MARVARGRPYTQLNVPTTVIQLLSANPNRAGLRIDVIAGTGNVAISFDDPAVTVTGDTAGEIIGQNESYIEANPEFVNTGSVWAVSANGDEDIKIREDWAVED